MERELAFLDLAGRLRDRVSEQRLAMERLKVLLEALMETANGQPQRVRTFED